MSCKDFLPEIILLVLGLSFFAIRAMSGVGLFGIPGLLLLAVCAMILPIPLDIRKDSRMFWRGLSISGVSLVIAVIAAEAFFVMGGLVINISESFWGSIYLFSGLMVICGAYFFLSNRLIKQEKLSLSVLKQQFMTLRSNPKVLLFLAAFLVFAAGNAAIRQKLSGLIMLICYSLMSVGPMFFKKCKKELCRISIIIIYIVLPCASIIGIFATLLLVFLILLPVSAPTGFLTSIATTFVTLIASTTYFRLAGKYFPEWLGIGEMARQRAVRRAGP